MDPIDSSDVEAALASTSMVSRPERKTTTPINALSRATTVFTITEQMRIEQSINYIVIHQFRQSMCRQDSDADLS